MTAWTRAQTETPVAAYPTQAEAAEMLGVAASTLSRDPSLRREAVGRREQRLPVAEVLRLARIHRRRPINETALALLRHAETNAPGLADQISEEIDAFFEGSPTAGLPADQFLEEAKRALPPALYAEVERVYTAGRGERPADITGRE